MADVFAAISDPTRRAILRLVSGRKLPAGRIAAEFNQQRPAISKHLTILKESGLLIESRRRQERLYSIKPGALDVLRVFLAEIRPPDEGVIHTASAPVVPQTTVPPGKTRMQPTQLTEPVATPRPPTKPQQPPPRHEPDDVPAYARPGFNLEFD